MSLPETMETRNQQVAAPMLVETLPLLFICPGLTVAHVKKPPPLILQAFYLHMARPIMRAELMCSTSDQLCGAAVCL